MRILGLDVGDRHIGIAVSDSLGITAQGLKTIDRKETGQTIAELKLIIEEYDVESIVVGLPKMLNGTTGVQGEKVISFVDEIKREIPLPVILWDERMSTVIAERLLVRADMSRKRRKGLRDKIAASIILQGYLDNLSTSIK